MTEFSDWQVLLEQPAYLWQIGYVRQIVSMPFESIQDPASRVYWPFLLASIVIALVVLTLDERVIKPKNWLRRFFSRRYFFSNSSAVDFVWWLVNSFLRIALVVPLVGGHLAFTLVVVRFLRTHFGDVDVPMLAPIVMMTLYTLFFLILEDLSRFSLHRLMHAMPLLWRIHKVHHSATVLTPFTLFRLHPVEMFLYYLRGLFVFGSVSGLFIFLWGADVKGWQVLGVDAIGFIFNLAAANLRHSHIWLSFGWFERWLISPAQHQLHHSNNPQHFNKNFGAILAVWDRCFNSWISIRRKPEELTFGLKSALHSNMIRSENKYKNETFATVQKSSIS